MATISKSDQHGGERKKKNVMERGGENWRQAGRMLC
jgi:hypothetical protein